MESPSFHSILIFLGAYLIGSFPTGVVLSRQKYGMDVREMGSGNIGATNVTRVFGWYAGIVTLLIDFAKGYVPIFLLHRFYPAQEWLLTFASISLVVGHCFSIFLKFQGGKGVATGLGTVMVLSPVCGAIAIGVYAVVVLVSKISALGSLAGILSCVVFLWKTEPPEPILFLIAGVSSIVLARHTGNIKRLIFDRKEKT